MKNLLKKLKLPVDLVIVIAVTSILILCLLTAKSIFFKQPNYLKLPFDTTLLAFEWNTDTTSSNFKALSRKMGLPNAIQFIEIEKLFVSKFADLKIPVSVLASKTFTLQKNDQEINPVLILSFKNKQDLNAYKVLPGFVHFQKNNNLYVATKKEALEPILKSHKTLQLNSSVQDVISNLPKDNIANFYLNHNLLTADLISGPLAMLEDVNTTFNITGAVLRETDLGLIFSTYTNPVKGLKFPYTRTKYLSALPKVIPSNQLLFLGGTGASSRLIKLAQNLPQFESEPDLVANKIFSILNTYNLSPNSLKFLTEIFQNEFAITLNDLNEWTLFYQDFSRFNNQKVNAELDKFTAFLNPKKISYLLEDGQVANQLVPNEKATGTTVTPNLKKFTLSELNADLYWGTNEYNKYAYLSASYNPFLALSFSNQKLAEEPFFKKGTELLLPIADEILFVRKDLIHTYLNTYFDLRDIPNILTASNFFTDGIQTVTLMQW